MTLRGVVAVFGLAGVACSTNPVSPTGAVAGTSDLSAPAAVGTLSKGTSTDSIKVSKCYTNATATSGGEMLIKASSSDTTATLTAYRPDGSVIGVVQNGGGSRYGGTVMPYQPYDPVNVTIKSSTGGTITVPTTPFQL